MKIDKVQSEKKKSALKWNMIAMLLLCWLIPVMLLTLSMLYIVSDKTTRQTENTIRVSADKAVETCQLRIADAITASRNASYMPNIRTAYLNYLDDGDYQKLHSEVTTFLEQQYKYSSSFLSTMVFFSDNPNDVFFTHRNTEKSSYTSSVKQFMREGMQVVLEEAKDIGTQTIFVEVNGHVYMVRNMMNIAFTPYAVIVMELDTRTVFESLNSILGCDEYDIFINGKSLLNTEFSYDYPLDYLTYKGNLSKYISEKGAHWIYKSDKADCQQITYMVSLDERNINAEVRAARYVFLFWGIFMIPLVCMVFYFFHRNVTRPINKLSTFLKQIGEGNYGITLNEKFKSKEFDYLSQSINGMSKELKQQFDRIYLEEIALKDAKIMALQSQINPHFLNNTLEIINWEARMSDNLKVSVMIEALSTMLEATMNRKKQPFITLTEELSYVDAYLYIISQRFGDKFVLSKDIDSSLMRVPVPRLIIQPIIENAVEHGMNIQKRGEVTLKVYSDGQKLYIEIHDNGILTQKDRERIDNLLDSNYTEKNDQSTSLGIRNVDLRLRILYGEECGLQIRSAEDGHTISTIIVKLSED